MIQTRAIFVEGLPATGKSLLAQRLKLQLDLHDVECHWFHAEHRAHPLHRAYDPSAFASVDEYALTLAVQWQNFAARTGAEPGVWIFDAALLEPAPPSLLAAGLREDRVDALVAELLGTVAPLSPVLLYLWRETPADADPGWVRFRDWADGVFAHRTERRLLINRSLVGQDEALGDALGILGLTRLEPELPDRLADALEGRYAAAGGEAPRGEVRVAPYTGVPAEAPLAVTGLPGLPASAQVPLLPASARELWLAGSTLRLLPQRDAAGRVLGFTLASVDPRESVAQSFFTRIDGAG